MPALLLHEGHAYRLESDAISGFVLAGILRAEGVFWALTSGHTLDELGLGEADAYVAGGLGLLLRRAGLVASGPDLGARIRARLGR